MQLGRHKRWNWRTGSDSNAGNVTPKNVVVPVINVMVTRVAGRCDCTNFKWLQADDIVVVQDLDAVLRHGRNLSPEALHVGAENARRRLNQLRGIDQVRRATWMHVDGRRFSEPPGGAGVVEMNVT